MDFYPANKTSPSSIRIPFSMSINIISGNYGIILWFPIQKRLPVCDIQRYRSTTMSLLGNQQIRPGVDWDPERSFCDPAAALFKKIMKTMAIPGYNEVIISSNYCGFRLIIERIIDVFYNH
jgi:hypothetical protein